VVERSLSPLVSSMRRVEGPVRPIRHQSLRSLAAQARERPQDFVPLLVENKALDRLREQGLHRALATDH
jgi:hypothetical protein